MRLRWAATVPPVDIHHITEDLEGVEADANGQRHPQKRHRKAGHGIEAADEEIGVLAVAQKQQAERTEAVKKSFDRRGLLIRYFSTSRPKK